jgi:alkanesulfonate monooxygenase SsuD/methylene tetrahydromethanopterin reductase-like flavin-dependent oxidoreductase (luciferase family)
VIEVGLMLDMRNPPAWRRPWDRLYAQTLEQVEEAERLGATSVWTSEHHFFEDGYLPQPLTFAAALAARTKTMRIGTAILLAPLRPAVQIAEEAAVVDLVSGGRLDLGLGAGYRQPEFEAFGADREARFATLRERVEQVRELLEGGRVTPPPVQNPLPIWFGAGSPVAARRAGRKGLPQLNGRSEVGGPYQEGLREGGQPPGTGRMAGLLNLLNADDPDEAWARARPHF